MVAAVQRFPPEWKFAGRKTAMYRQIGNAFPPPVARAVGTAIHRVLDAADGADAREPELAMVGVSS
jgi:DNA (cytosine-5)-methyltransferase 1